MELASLVAQAETFVLPLEPRRCTFLAQENPTHSRLYKCCSTLTALSVSPHSDDVWCLDWRGVLTLHLSAESYQTLGITGQKLPFKSHSSEHSEPVRWYLKFRRA